MLSRFRRIPAWCLSVFFPIVAFAGQSLVLTRVVSIQVVDPIVSPDQSWRVEFQFHNWTIPPAGFYHGTLFDLSGTGAKATISPDGRIAIEGSDSVTRREPCFISTAGLTNALVRIQKNAKTLQFSCEAWNFDGSHYQNEVMDIAALQPKTYAGGVVGGGGTAALGFLRVSTKLMPLGGRPPTTADGGDWTELKFDGNLKDSSGHNHHGVDYTGQYIPTPNQVAFASPRTSGAPSWSAWTSLRAGFPAQLDASASYSLADASSAVSYSWQQLKGPSTVIWSSRTTVNPTLEGLIFGTYTFSLRVADMGGNTASGTLEAGAVATDDNGVVVNADPKVDRIFGPMIAFGRSPWGFMDERALTATRLRIAAYNAQGLNPPSWDIPGPGTVTYRFGGTGLYNAPAKLTRAITAEDKQISVSDVSTLNLSSFPTRVLLLANGPREELRVCSASATKGPAILTLCYDGRGFVVGDHRTGVARPWPVGTGVGQMKVQGSGSRFLSVLCTGGPGPNGDVIYAKGSMRLTAGSSAAQGIGTDWTANNGARNDQIVRVSATHGGVPFVFVAYIAAVADPTHITLTRPYPADADTGSFSYSIILRDTREITLHYTRPADGADAQTYWPTSGCESDTEVFLFDGFDVPSLNGSLQAGKKYSYMDNFGYTGAFGANFYGEDLAHRALYYRSGWEPALQAARVMGDNYVDAPQIAGGDIGSMTLLVGGGVVGGFVAAILDQSDSNRPSWSTLRGLARNGSIGGLGCNDTDTRDSGYAGTWLTLAADYDPDPVQRAKWQAQLALVYARDQRCKGTDNSWAHGFLFNTNGPALSMKNGSAIATGTNLPREMCFGVASGTIDVTAGSATSVGTGFVKGNQIVVNGTRHGLPYTGFFAFKMDSPGTITMAALWPGDSGQATYVIENNDDMNTIATSNEDRQLTRNWACTWNSPTQITLDRPWDGPTETGAHLFPYTLAGFGQQPFMLGIKITQMKFASQIKGLPFAAKYGDLAAAAAKWIHDVGYDPVTQGLYYGRIYQACEPATIPPPGSTFDSRTPNCNNGLAVGATRAARVLLAEASQALRVYYEANPTPEARAWGDRAYGSIWGNPLYTAPGFYSDPTYVKDENSDIGLGSYKWTGFFFGMGMAHQWPAVRLGGVAPPKYRTVSLQIKPASAPKTRIWVIAPSGERKAYACESATTCDVIVDDRQGSHWYTIQYLSAEDKVISQSAPALIGRP